MNLITSFLILILSCSNLRISKCQGRNQFQCSPLLPTEIAKVALRCQLFNSNVPNADCSRTLPTGSSAEYWCQNRNGDLFTGILECASPGLWRSNLRFGNSSLCGLNGLIVNIQTPDMIVLFGEPQFPIPQIPFSLRNQHPSFKDYEVMALRIHNELRKLHKAPPLKLDAKLCGAAQKLAILTAFNNENSIQNGNPSPPFNIENILINNVEMNWYFQTPLNSNANIAVSNAIQSWYVRGKQSYNFEHVESNFTNETALTFSKVVWKQNTHLGVGVVNSGPISFVICIYIPGRNVKSVDPTKEFSFNVIP